MRHATREALVCTVQSNIQADRPEQASIIRAAATSDPSYVELLMKIEILYNNIYKGYYDLSNRIPIQMLDSEKTEYVNEFQTYREPNASL